MKNLKIKHVLKSMLVIILINIVSFSQTQNDLLNYLANDVKSETLKSWKAYCKYAWGHDELLPLSESYTDWYEKPLYLIQIDAYSTLKMMGFEEETKRIENFIADSTSFDDDMFVKTFEVNIRVLGGLLSMYDFTKNEKILAKAKEFGNRISPAFNSTSGMPYYDVNLKTGEVRGDTICAAEAGSYLVEMGVLSYYTKDPRYYQMAKKATRAVYSTRSNLNLIGRNYSVSTGEALDSTSQVGCFVDSYYEYIYKAWLLFDDPELKEIWDTSISAINKYVGVETDTCLWYGIVNSYTGKLISSDVTLWDAYFPALLIYSGNTEKAINSLKSWNYLWAKNRFLPFVYNFQTDQIKNPKFYLNPELYESAYYIWYYTKNPKYLELQKEYYSNLKKYCKTDIAYAHLDNIITKEQSDGLSTYFFAETMKYFYLTFSFSPKYNLGDYVFNTEAHPLKISNFNKNEAKIRLGI